MQWPTWSSLSRHSHSYRRATKAGQTILEQAKAVLSTSLTLSQATNVRLTYKRVDFLETAKHIAMADMVGEGLRGAPTLLDVCSFLGMGREGESGEEREGGGVGCQVSGPLESADSVGLASCSFEGRTGEKVEK